MVIDILLTIVLAPLVAILLWAVFFAYLFVFATACKAIDKVFGKRRAERHPPYCSINPLEHPSFVWSKDGRGVINGVDTGLREA